MTCKKQILGSINGLPDILAFLDGQASGTTNVASDNVDEEWPESDPSSWEWTDDVAAPPSAAAAEPPSGGELDWPDACQVALSPLADVLVLATDRRIAILTAQWDSESSQSRFGAAAKLEAPDDVTVTSLLCLPMASPQRSWSGAADWTCIVVGQESGHIAFFTEDGSLLLRQRLHQSAVCSVSCSCRQVAACAEEELSVVFEDAVVVLDGFALYQTLRGCRSRLARLRAGGGGGLEAPLLAQQKWELRHQQRLETAQNVGFLSTSLLDHLQQESLLRPGGSVTSASVPAGSLLVTAGRCPFVGFFHAAEGAEQARLEQVVRGVASKVKDTVFSTIGNIWSGGTAQSKPEPEMEPGNPIKCRFGLPDVQRHGQLMALSRDRRLCAVTDNFGRVTLVDNHAGVAVAMWKGYRDAECGWLECREPRGSDGRRSGRRAAFLVLYAPRRGLLEVWTPAGTKAAAFNVTKHGRLMNICHGVIGQSEADPGRRASKLVQCVLLAPDGRLVTLEVPFHLALSEHGSRRAHGQQLLRQLRQLLRAPPADAGQLLRAQLEQLRTAGARRQALEMVLGCGRLATADMDAVLDAALDSCAAEEPSSLEPETQQLLQLALGYKRLLAAYSTLSSLADSAPGHQPEGEAVTAQTLASALRISPASASGLLSRLQAAGAEGPAAEEGRPRVSFAEEQRRPSAAAFLRCFHVKPSPQGAAVAFKENIAEDDYRLLGDLVFEPCLVRLPLPADWERAVLAAGLPPEQLLRLLASCWLQMSARLRPRQLLSLDALLHTVAAAAGGAGPAWQEVQELVSESSHVQRALLLATVCRGVAVKLEDLGTSQRSGEAHMTAAEPVDRKNSPTPMDTETPLSSEQTREDPLVPSDNSENPTETAEMAKEPAETAEKLAETAEVAEKPAETVEKPSETAEKPAEAAEVSEVAEKPAGAEAGAASPDAGWERLTAVTVSWDLQLHQLADLVALCDALPPPARPDLSLHALIKKGPGAVSELVARWLLNEGALPTELAPGAAAAAADVASEAPPEDAEEARRPPAPAEECTEDMEVEDNRPQHRFHGALSQLAARFPHSVAADALLLNCCWEETASWGRRRELTRQLDSALEFAARIHSAHLRYGVCCLLWTGVLRQPCSAAAALLQRSGRSPDDTSCRRELQLPATQLPQLLHSCRQLLQMMIMSMVACESEPPPVLYNDNLWATQSTGVRCGPASLLDMAARQRRCAEDLAAMHLQMLDVMRAQVHLGIKNVHPYHCFNDQDRAFLFGDPFAPYQEPAAVDQAVRCKRETTLCRWTTAAVRLISERPDGQADVTEASVWVSRAEELARVWNVTADVVRRQYTLDLYNAGHDHLAAEVLSGLSRPAEVSSQLLLLAGARLRHYIHTSSHMIQLLGRLTVNVADFLKIADVPLQCAAVPLDRTLLLLRRVARLEAATPAEHRITLELIDLVEGLPKSDRSTAETRR